MTKKKLGAAFISLAVSGFAGLMLVAPGALATGQGHGNVGGSVRTKEACDWRIQEIPASVTLASALVDPQDDQSAAVYDGTAMTLSSVAQDQNVYVTGNLQGANSDSLNTKCIFYNVPGAGTDQTRPTVSMATTGTGVFEATYQGDTGAEVDSGMQVTLGTLTGTSPLGVAFVECVDSANVWTTTDLNLGASKSATSVEIPTIGDVDQSQQKDDGLRCNQTYVVSIALPEGVVPDSPGAVYTFSGVVLTTTLNTSKTD